MRIRPSISKNQRFLITLSFSAVIIFIILFVVPRVHAESFSWTTGSFALSEEQKYTPAQPCKVRTVSIRGASMSTETASVCVYERPYWRYAWYNNYFVVGVGDDSSMYAVTNMTSQRDTVELSESNDLVFNTLTMGFTNNHRFTVIKNFPSQLQLTGDGIATPRHYELKSGAEQPLVPNEQGEAITTGAVGASPNGHWLAMEDMSSGLLLIDTRTYELRWFSNLKIRYGVGSDAHITFIISNDGAYVATFDYNIEPKIYALHNNCTVRALHYTQAFVSQTQSAPSCSDDGGRMRAALSTRFSANEIRSMRADRFGEKGDQLHFLRYNYGSDPGMMNMTTYDFALQSSGYVPSPGLDYLALGDSYSSGEGDTLVNPATSQKYYRDYTDNEENAAQYVPREKCHVSTRSYPYLLAQGMGLSLTSPSQWNSVACSGAQAWDVKGQGNGYYTGQNERLKSYDVASLKAQALNEFIPGREKQVEFVKRYKPKVITLTMGGNDVGFADKIKSCAMPGTCEVATAEGRSALGSQIRNQYDKLKSLYEELYSSSGSAAKIYVLGYPKFINGNSEASCEFNTGALGQDEREMINESVGYMNDVIKQAARVAGVKYVDIENSLDGHRLCEDEEKYVTGITNIFGWNGNELQESFHPNAKGNHAMAMAVWSEQNMNSESLLDYDICPSSDQNACPDVSATKDSITVPSYFESSEPERNITYSKISQSDAAKGAPMNITTGLYSLAPLSSARLTLHSDPVDLGSYEVNSEGRLEVAIQVPTTIPAGYHTLLLNGETYSGEEVEYEQIILVKGSDPNDIDEDSVSDDVDPCLFISPANIDDDGDGIDDACDIEIGEKASPYRVRPGDVARTYNSAPENELYFYIERRIAASPVTGITDDYDPDNDGWAIVGASRGRPYTTSSVPDIGPVANYIILGEATDTRPFVYIRAGGYGCVGYTPASLKKVKPDQNRTIKRVAVNTDKCRKEAPADDVDKNGLPDNTQPLYDARNGDSARGEDPSRIYLLRNFHAAEAQLGISDYSPTGTAAGRGNEPIQEWNLLASSKEGVYIPTFNKLGILEDSEGKPLPTVLTKKQNGQCIAYQPRNTKVIKQTTQDTRRLIKLAKMPEGVDCD